MPAEPFVWWGNTGDRASPDEVRAYRDAAASLATQHSRTPTNPWEGLAALTAAWGEHQWRKRAIEAERAGRAEYNDLVRSMLESGSPDQATLMGAMTHDWATPQGQNLASALWQRQNALADRDAGWERADAIRADDRAYNAPMRDLQLRTGEVGLEQALLELEQARDPMPPVTAEQSNFLFGQQHPDFLEFIGVGAPTAPDYINVETLQGIRTFNLSNPAQAQEVDALFSSGQGRQVGIGAGDSARESQIERLLETGMDRNTAIGIVDGRLRADRHPVTGELQVVDMATGQPVYGGPNVPAQAPAPNQPGALDAAFGAVDQATDPNLNAIMNGNTPNSPFGPQYPAANQSFGLEGAATAVVNTIGDAIGVGAPYPNVQQTQADFGVLRESLLNDIASAYNRQPPSWLLQEIRNLTPAAGSPFEGTGTAVSKLNAIGRHLANELELSTQALERALSPQNRQEVEARVQGLQAGIARVQSAIQAFGAEESEGAAGQPDADGWVTLPNGVRVREMQ